jgi:transmembrane sensor
VSATATSDFARQAAATWHDRLLRGGVSEETRQTFRRWLAQSPEHERAYAAIDRAWSVLQAGAQEPEILALRHEAALRLSRDASRSLRPLRFATAVALVLALGGVATLLVRHPLAERSILAWVLEPFNTETDRIYTTAVGERLVVTLPDGSQVTLDTRSQLRVAWSKRERNVKLVRGQALFEVAKDRTRPFVVEARNQRLVAVGTAFDVRVEGRQMKVTMVEGTVRVEPATATLDGRTTSPSPVRMLTAGEQLVVNAQSEDYIHRTNPDRATSWQRGQLIFDDTRLEDAVGELNRYSQTQIVLADPTLADLRLSGAFATGRPNVFVEAVTSYFAVAVASRDSESIVLKAR